MAGAALGKGRGCVFWGVLSVSRRILCSRVSMRGSLTAACVVIVMWWAATGWYSLLAAVAWVDAETSLGIVAIVHCPSEPAAWNLHLIDLGHLPLGERWSWWWWRYERWKPNGLATHTYIAFPIWLPLLLLSLPTAYLWLRRDIVPGHCRKCRYDLSALPPNSPCPECGRTQEQ